MLLIPCPWCGPRSEQEFSYGGDATKAMPDLALRASIGDWHDYVHRRSNPRGLHRELWYHSFGCERWVLVERDTVSHDIIDAWPPGRIAKA